MAELSAAQVRARVAELGPWFHNMELKGVRTAPDHFLHDYPANKFARFAHVIPDDLSGRSVLDIGCNAGTQSRVWCGPGETGHRDTGIDIL